MPSKNECMAAATVCCPNCWSWAELGKSPTCKRCGTPLIYPDGTRVDGMSASPPAPPPAASSAPPAPPPLGGAAVLPPPPPPSIGAPAYAGAPLTAGGSYFSLATQRTGTDWVAIARVITIAYGALIVIVMLIVGLAVRHVSVPVADPYTGRSVVETLDIGPAMVVAALIVAALFALFAWLMQFTVMRAIVLFIVALGAIGALARLSTGSPGVAAGALVSLAIDAGFGFVLVKSLIRSQPQY
jgi:hypothetical protein